MGYSVLVVDDDPLKRQLLRLILERAGFGVAEAADGQEALTVLAESVPDLMTLDVMMPHHDGYEVCEMLKSDPEFAGTYIIMLTAKGQQADIERGRQAGADEYVTKPFDMEYVLRTAAKALESGTGFSPPVFLL